MVSRRGFIKQAVVATGALSVGLLLKTQSTWAKSKLPMIDMKQKNKKDALNNEAVSVAKGLGYVDDATKATRPERQGVPGAKQTCATCNWYTADGGCQLIAQGKVAVDPKGWCNSWMKKM